MFQTEILKNSSSRSTRIIEWAVKRTISRSHQHLCLKLDKQNLSTGKRPQKAETFWGSTNKIQYSVGCSHWDKDKTGLPLRSNIE